MDSWVDILLFNCFIRNQHTVGAVYFEFVKAFVAVFHTKLLHKLAAWCMVIYWCIVMDHCMVIYSNVWLISCLIVGPQRNAVMRQWYTVHEVSDAGSLVHVMVLRAQWQSSLAKTRIRETKPRTPDLSSGRMSTMHITDTHTHTHTRNACV